MIWFKRNCECVKGWFENNQRITFGVFKELYKNKDNVKFYFVVEESFAKDLGTNLERLKHVIKLMIDAELLSVQTYPEDASKHELQESYIITDKGMAYFSQKSLEKADKNFVGLILKHIPIISIVLSSLSFVIAIIALIAVF